MVGISLGRGGGRLTSLHLTPAYLTPAYLAPVYLTPASLRFTPVYLTPAYLAPPHPALRAPLSLDCVNREGLSDILIGVR